jgi:hypothetical protein
VFFYDHCELAAWARSQNHLKEKLDFTKYIWPDGIQKIDAKLIAAIPSAC